MSQNRVFEWYRRFRDGRENTEDDPRSGRPSTAITDKNVEKVKQIVLANRRIIVRELAEEVEASFESCRKILVDVLGVRRLAAKFVPKLLNF
ncbi:protein GVQW3-like [Ooceraea biroi]|nr:protein GVQW3-like [Ooceraea biroi]